MTCARGGCCVIERLFVLLATATLGACASTSREMAFHEDDESAFLLVAMEPGQGSGAQGYEFLFQRVDIETSKFEKDGVSVYFSQTSRRIEGDELDTPQDLETRLRFGGKRVPRGDYAIVMRYESFGQDTRGNCYSLGTPVYELRAGTLNLVLSAPARGPDLDRAAVLALARRIVAGYPNLTAPMRHPNIVAVVTFDALEDALGAQTCRLPKTFEITEPSGGR